MAGVSAPSSYSYNAMIQDSNKSSAPGTIFGINFVGSINPLTTNVVKSGTANVSTNRTKAILQTGATSNSFVFVESAKLVEFDRGEDISIRFSGIYSTPVANAVQLIGVGSTNNGLFFGYNGSNFGVLRRYDGSQETQVLNLGGAASATGDIQITLDGASANVSISSGDTISQVATYITATDFSGVSGGWTPSNNGNGAIFTAMTSGVRPGSYSISTSTGITGTFGEIIVGVPATDVWALQSAWNVDKATDASSLETVDFTKGNSYEIKFNGDGFGRILYSMRSSYDGKYYPVHIDEYLNAYTIPALSEARLPLALIASNGDSATNVSVQSTHLSAEISPEIVDNSTNATIPKFVVSSSVPNLTVPKLVSTNFLSLRNGASFNGLPNSLQIQILSINYSYSGSGTLLFTMSKRVNYSNAPYAYIATDPTSASSYFNYASSPAVQVTGGTVVRQWMATNGSALQVDVVSSQIFLNPGEEISISLKTLSNANFVASDIALSLVFLEG